MTLFSMVNDKNNAFSSQDKGHLGSRSIMCIYTYDIYMYSLDFWLDERTQETLSKRCCIFLGKAGLAFNSISWLHRCKKRNIDLPFLCEY